LKTNKLLEERISFEREILDKLVEYFCSIKDKESEVCDEK